MDDGKLLSVQLLEATDYFFARKLATAFPFVLIGTDQDIIHGKNTLRDAVVIYDGKAAHLANRHGAERGVNFVVWFASEDGSCGNLPDGQISRE